MTVELSEEVAAPFVLNAIGKKVMDDGQVLPHACNGIVAKYRKDKSKPWFRYDVLEVRGLLNGYGPYEGETSLWLVVRLKYSNEPFPILASKAECWFAEGNGAPDFGWVRVRAKHAGTWIHLAPPRR